MIRRRRAAVALEFAMVLPILVLMLGAILELSWFISQFRVMTRAARDAARVGSVTLEGPYGDGSSIEAAAEAQALTMIEEAGYACNTDCDIDAVWEQDLFDGYYYVRVSIEYPYDAFTLTLPFLGPTMTAEFTMLTQQQ